MVSEKHRGTDAAKPVPETTGFDQMFRAFGGPWGEAWVDSWQRSVLFLDVLRQRGNQNEIQQARAVPNVLSFECDVVLDGRKLKHPVNYGLVRIEPPAGVTIDPVKRPFVVIDPRAGHQPGIGGFKADSEIGVAMKAGHSCYFIGFTPEPMPGQTIEHILEAQALFIETVIARHPEAEGKPCVIGNCQAGWALMMLASLRPELFGPLIVAGSPLSYWAGVRGQNPMRYTGGTLGGSWLTALMGDLGCGKFDGASLVSNFESLNPANTLWGKSFNLWSKVDTEAARYLGFERWWGGHVDLNAEEMQFIVDELFVGNRLATAEIVTSEGERIDLRQISSPIVCFCSKGDNITPPQQALGWITDLYADDENIVAHGQTIVYAIHETVGHLGIFVSGGVAKKEHQEFASNIDLIDCLPPGLYEAVMIPKSDGAASSDLVSGDYIVRLEARSLADIRALGNNDLEDERRFAAAARVSEINLGLYRTFLQPFVRAAATEQSAAMMRALHPARLEFEMFSDQNPLMRPVAALAEQIRASRQPAASDNPLVHQRGQLSEAITTALDTYRDARDKAIEASFHAVYGSPLLQAMVGLKASEDPPRRRPGEEPEELAFMRARMEELRAKLGEGGIRAALVRSVLWIGLTGRAIDERTFNTILQIRAEHPDRLPLAEFKQLLRDQYLTLLLDEKAALEAIPAMLADDPTRRQEGLAVIRRIVDAIGVPEGERAARLGHIERMFEGADGTAGAAPIRSIKGGRG